jgi:restriction system protein
MKRKAVHVVIADILRDADRLMTVKEIYDAIVEGRLYKFQAKDPYNIVRNQLSRHSVENSHSCAATAKQFRMTSDGRFTNL